jgi:hypothetical protein
MAAGNTKLAEIATAIIQSAVDERDETTLAAEIPTARDFNTRLQIEITAFREDFERQQEEKKDTKKKPPAKGKQEEVEEFKVEDILDIAIDPELVEQADLTLRQI